MGYVVTIELTGYVVTIELTHDGSFFSAAHAGDSKQSQIQVVWHEFQTVLDTEAFICFGTNGFFPRKKHLLYAVDGTCGIHPKYFWNLTGSRLRKRIAKATAKEWADILLPANFRSSCSTMRKAFAILQSMCKHFAIVCN